MDAFSKFFLTAFGILSSSLVAFGKPPNVVLIVSDDQGYADLGCFGSNEVRTPHLDRLAEGGVKLTSFYVAWPACTPSRGALLTGRYPQRNGIYDMIRNVKVLKELLNTSARPKKKDSSELKFMLQDILITYFTLYSALTPDFVEHAEPIIKDLFNQVVSGMHSEEVIEAVLKKKSLPKNACWLTFDDGYIDHYKYVFPYLKKKKKSQQIFIHQKKLLKIK